MRDQENSVGHTRAFFTAKVMCERQLESVFVHIHEHLYQSRTSKLVEKPCTISLMSVLQTDNKRTLPVNTLCHMFRNHPCPVKQLD